MHRRGRTHVEHQEVRAGDGRHEVASDVSRWRRWRLPRSVRTFSCASTCMSYVLYLYRFIIICFISHTSRWYLQVYIYIHNNIYIYTYVELRRCYKSIEPAAWLWTVEAIPPLLGEGGSLPRKCTLDPNGRCAVIYIYIYTVVHVFWHSGNHLNR